MSDLQVKKGKILSIVYKNVNFHPQGVGISAFKKNNILKEHI